MISFQSEKHVTRYLDPRNDFADNEVESELRVDPLTGASGRLCHFGGLTVVKPDLSELVSISRQAGCPFCPDLVDKVTPKFPADLVVEGRVKVGEAVVFPNLFPYDVHSAVCAISHAHFVPLTGFGAELLVNGFRASLEYVGAVRRREPEVVGLVSWNYMPPAGGSQIHPHLQVVATRHPGNKLTRLWHSSREFVRVYGANYWTELLEVEEEKGERYIGKSGRVTWLTSFQPTGTLGDVLGVFPGRRKLGELDDDDLLDLAGGLIRVWRGLDAMGVYSFNLAFYEAAEEDEPFLLHVRLIPRISIQPQLRAADTNSLQMLYEEPFAMVYPEVLAEKLRFS